MASAVGMPVNVVPAEGSYVLKQLEDGTTVLLDAVSCSQCSCHMFSGLVWYMLYVSRVRDVHNAFVVYEACSC